MRRLAKAVALAAVLLLPGAAHAVEVSLGVGAGYWFENAAQFDLNARVDWRLAKYFSLGVRPGVVMNVRSGVQFGIPVNAVARFHIPHINFDIAGGLYILFADPVATFRGHIAAGFSVPVAKHISLGGEAGYLWNGAQLLFRFSYTF
ncbi:MAG: hypothetical protein IT380_27975 [Myxococcales bacterium]|nr:hypothetical protein [Myxococcales bacterium]